MWRQLYRFLRYIAYLYPLSFHPSDKRLTFITSWRITSPYQDESISAFPSPVSSDAELWCFFDVSLNILLHKKWRHCNYFSPCSSHLAEIYSWHEHKSEYDWHVTNSWGTKHGHKWWEWSSVDNIWLALKTEIWDDHFFAIKTVMWLSTTCVN